MGQTSTPVVGGEPNPASYRPEREKSELTNAPIR